MAAFFCAKSCYLYDTNFKIMREVFVVAAFLLGSVIVKGQSGKLDTAKKLYVVEASCGQCQFGLKSKQGCDLAVRIDGKAYFVDGTKIDEHGDAHASDGFCEAVRKAEVQGKIVKGRFKSSYFKLLPVAPKE